MSKKSIIGILLTTASFATFAETNNVFNLSLSANINEFCIIRGPDIMAFGNVTNLFQTSGQQTTSLEDEIQVRCNKNLSYSVGVSPVSSNDLVTSSSLLAKYPNIANIPRHWYAQLNGAKPVNSYNLYMNWALDSIDMNIGDNSTDVNNFRIAYSGNGSNKKHTLRTTLVNYGRAQLPTVDSYSTIMQITVDY